MDRKKLGRGLDSLIQDDALTSAGEEVALVSVDDIRPNSRQPRKDFDEESLEGLARSIVENGVLQPIIVRKAGSGYEVIAGERRWRAATKAGLESVPAVIRNVSDEKLLQLAIIENIQREDLNPIEKARAYRELMEEFSLTQEQAASRLGIGRANLANTLRLLELPEEVQLLVSRGTITFGHARALLGASSAGEMIRLAERIVRDDLSVRQTETIIGKTRDEKGAGGSKSQAGKEKGAQIRHLEEQLRASLGTRVTITEGSRKGRGKIVVEFFSHDDFERVFAKMTGSEVSVM